MGLVAFPATPHDGPLYFTLVIGFVGLNFGEALTLRDRLLETTERR